MVSLRTVPIFYYKFQPNIGKYTDPSCKMIDFRFGGMFDRDLRLRLSGVVKQAFLESPPPKLHQKATVLQCVMFSFMLFFRHALSITSEIWH